MCFRTDFPKGAFVTITNNGGEGRIAAHADKFGESVLVDRGFDKKWVKVNAVTIVADTERKLDCDGCNGSGIYYGRGIIENGVFKGFTGDCYRCHGTGKQNPKDRGRNRYYDNHVRSYYA